MKPSFTMNDCKFYVNEEKRTIVCVIPDTSDALMEYFSTRVVIDYEYFSDLVLPNCFKGKAVCAPEDEWNEELGRKIAYSRARDKFYSSFFRRANTYVNKVDLTLARLIEDLNNYGTRLQDYKDKLELDIDNELKK